MNANFHLFVYGSLRSGFDHPAFEYIKKYFSFVGQGKVKGLIYDLGEYPAAIPGNDDHYIIGEVYQIKEQDEFSYAIAQLDDYEGVNQENGESLYRREIATIEMETGSLQAWIYWYNEKLEGYPLVESGDLMEYLKGKRN